MSKPIYAVADVAQTAGLKKAHEEASRRYREVQGLSEDTVLTPENVKANTPEGFAVVRTGQEFSRHVRWINSPEYQQLQQRLAK